MTMSLHHSTPHAEPIAPRAKIANVLCPVPCAFSVLSLTIIDFIAAH